MPTRRPSTPPSSVARSDGSRLRDRRGVARVVAPDRLEQQRGVVDAAGERPDLIERRREGDEAVPRDRAVGRLDSDDAAERGGLADRAAGVGAERRATRTPPRPPRPNRPTSRRAPGVGSRGLRVGPNAEFSVDEPIANSSRLVLPTITAPARAQPLAPPSRRTAASSPRGSATSTWSATPRVQRLSLSAIGTPASGPGSRARGDRGVDRVGRGARVVVEHGVEGVDLALTRRDPRRGAPRARRSRGVSPAADAPRRSRSAGAAPSRLLARGCAGTRNRNVLGDRRFGEHLGAIEARAGNVGPQHVDQLDRVRRRRHVGGVERADDRAA